MNLPRKFLDEQKDVRTTLTSMVLARAFRSYEILVGAAITKILLSKLGKTKVQLRNLKRAGVPKIQLNLSRKNFDEQKDNLTTLISVELARAFRSYENPIEGVELNPYFSSSAKINL